jgi:thiamine-phosphate pyrophosphorylase
MDRNRAAWESLAAGNFPRLYAILDMRSIESRGLDLFAVAEAWCDAGVGLVQYRDKLSSSLAVLGNAARLREIFRTSETLLVLNDSPALAYNAGLRAVHIGQKDGTVGNALKSVEYVGVSTHNEREVRVADASSCSYIAIGPVFETSSKLDVEVAVGLRGIHAARALTNKPLVAIGGITMDNAVEVLRAGADSVAAISALLDGGDLLQRARDFMALVQSAQVVPASAE